MEGCVAGMQLACTVDAKSLMRGIIENIGDPVVVRQSLWVLNAMTWAARDRLKASNLSIIEGVCRLLARYPDDDVVAAQALGAIRHITCDSPENAARLGSSGCSSVFLAVKKYMSSESVVIDGLHVLAQAAQQKDNLKGVDLAAWVECLLGASAAFARNAEAVQAMCLVFGSTVHLCVTSLEEHSRTAVAKYCLQCLQSQSCSPAVTRAACQTVACLSREPAVQDLILEMGGVSLLVAILRGLESAADADDTAGAALQTLTNVLTAGSDTTENAKRAGAEGAVDAVLQRLIISMKNATVAEHGFHALKILFLEPLNQEAGGSDALELIESGLELHATHLAVVLYACQAVELLMELESVQELVFYSDLMDVLVSAMRTCLEPSSAATSPANSRTSSSSSIRLGMPNLPPPIRTVDISISEPLPPAPPDNKSVPTPTLVGSLHVSAVLVAACGALSASMGTNSFERARAAGAGEVVCTILRKYALFSDVVEHASWALSRLAFTTLGQIQLGNLGAVRILFEALNKHKDSPSVVECIVYGISNLTFDPNNATAALGLQAVQIMTGLLTSHATAGVIVERACVTISNVLTMQEDLSIVRTCGTIPVIVQVVCVRLLYSCFFLI